MRGGVLDGRARGTGFRSDARVSRVATVCVPVWLGSVAYSQPVLSARAFSFSDSYATNGEAIESVVPNRQEVRIAPVLGYSFSWNNSTGKMTAHDFATGAEVAGGTDLEAAGLTQLPATQIGKEEPRAVFCAPEDSRLTRVRLAVSTAHTANATDYWTVGLVRRTTAGGRRLLGTLTTDKVGFAAHTPRDVFVADEEEGLALLEGEGLEVEFTETLFPAPLTGAQVLIDLARRV